ncbi:FtsX-like permease family protein [Streptacidiphilus sp. P02-A3a]|uniref:FtsX-like permease family protein n=1 Tax=Streptacidiphilus sp. P02-A3a TaxID=2704468 RepID=UPI0015FBB4A5|nr:FtsX-like permease family protein [Streptacidiphilus sp. P02-A3a]QMU67762.1 FtsX-like permease family protein [Streptacidiphilus sp. P02-A3a]
MKLSAWRVALRMARRDALRAKGRSALVIAMIAIPVVGVAGADITYRSTKLTVSQAATRVMGTAQAEISAGQLGWRVNQAPNPADGSDVPSDDGSKPSPTAQEQARAKEPLAEQLRQALPSGVRLLPMGTGAVTTSTANGVLAAEVQAFDAADPLTHGIVVLDRGSWPTGPGQIAATTAFLADSGLRVGQTTTPVGTHLPLTITAAVEFPGSLKTDQLVLRPEDLDAVDAAQNLGRGAEVPTQWLLQMPQNAAFTWADVLRANQWGFTVTSRAVLRDPPPSGEVMFREDSQGMRADPVLVAVLSTVVGMALLEIVLLAGPAFAVGARRSRRQLGLMAAGGGDRAHIRAVVLGGGLVLGGAGALTGLVVGTAAVALGRGELESISGSRFGSFALRPLDLLGIVLVGLVTGLLAAVVPAVQAARQDVVASLTGRGTVKSPPKWLTALGALGVVGGTALALLGNGVGRAEVSILGGSVLAELGVVACTPFLVGLFGRLARLLPLAPRLALRDSTRNRSRTAPAVAAVMAAVAGAVAVSVYQNSSDASGRAAYQPYGTVGSVLLQFGGTDGATRIAAENSAVQRAATDLGPRGDLYQLYFRGNCFGDGAGPCGSVSVKTPGCPDTGLASADSSDTAPVTLSVRCSQRVLSSGTIDNESALAVNPAALPALGVGDPAAARALAQGTVLVSDPDDISDGKVTLDLQLQSAPEDSDHNRLTTTTVTLPAMLVTAHPRVMPVLMSATAAAQAGLRTAPFGSIWDPAHGPDGAEQQRINAALAQVTAGASVTVEHGYQSSSSAIALGLALAASVVAIGAAAIATGLAAADSQADLATLAAVGAAPRVRRVLSGFQCTVIAAMGAVLGAAAGIVPAWALWRYRSAGSGRTFFASSVQYRLVTPPDPLVLPWGTLAALVLGLPLLAWLLAAGLTRSRPVLTRRTA